MNYFAHARRFLEDPYFVAGTAVPDWLTVVDRQVRVRSKLVLPFVDDADPRTAAVARGIRQHIEDDARFHQSRVFAELLLELTAGVRETLAADSSFRTSFLAHLLVEVLLDASLIAEDPSRLEAYDRLLESVDAAAVQRAVNRMAARPTTRLATMISRFRQERILWDYLEDGTLLARLNQVMRRTRCDELPESFRDYLPRARRLVEGRKRELCLTFE